MALIQCSECSTTISDKARYCIKCGAPIASENITSGSDLVTTQETAKKFKVQILITSVLFWVGLCLWLPHLNNYEPPSSARIGQLLSYIGAFWYVVTKVQVWWNHG